MNAIATPIKREIASHNLPRGSAADHHNVGEWERWLSIAGGGLLALYGMERRDLVGLGLAVLGGAFVQRGWSGHCPVYQALHVSTQKHSRAAAVAAGAGVKVVRSIAVQAPPATLYALWANLDQLPRFMAHLVAVRSDGNRSHWVAKAPAGMRVEWDAEIVNQVPDRLIAWRSLEGSEVATAGSVHFTNLPGDKGTEIRVELKYDPPAGHLGAWLAWLIGQDPDRQIREDLRRFKQWIEAGEVAMA